MQAKAVSISRGRVKNLKVDHKDYLKLLRKLRTLPNVKKVFIRSGIRFDYLIADKDDTFFKELCEYHVSGQLKVAPEHVADPVLQKMGKPENRCLSGISKKYKQINEKLGKKQYLVPYLMSSHPGSTMKEAVALAEYLRDLAICRSRYRTSIRHRRRYRLVCTIREWIRGRWNLYMYRKST